jgi:hypothetical protein
MKSWRILRTVRLESYKWYPEMGKSKLSKRKKCDRSFYYANVVRMKAEETRAQHVGRSVHWDKSNFYKVLRAMELKELSAPHWTQRVFVEIIRPQDKYYRIISWNMLNWLVDRWTRHWEHFDGNVEDVERHFFPYLNEEYLRVPLKNMGGTPDQVYLSLNDIYYVEETKTGMLNPSYMSEMRQEMAFETVLINEARKVDERVAEKITEPVTYQSMRSHFDNDYWMESLGSRTFDALNKAIFEYHLAVARSKYPKCHADIGFCKHVCGYSQTCLTDTRAAGELPLDTLGLLMRDKSREVLERDFSSLLSALEVSF